ncbi:serine/threonine-protein kinase [Actinoplanes sp. NPDC049548]|uniref:serine/threonine-protein kinase n=1 Tax=Actinoplanes sp. NPDC049548 TaxID=3155152 RepID=UPI003447588D
MRSLAGRYKVEEAVGRGGSAVVHRGYDRTLKRQVAIKLFAPYRPGSTEPAVDVLREARTAAGLSHPNVARVYDYGEALEGDRRTPYLVMEFLEGDTLADELARTGALEWRRAAAVCRDTAAALAAAHERNLVHRDVKPRNVMLTPAGVKVLDFGIAAAAGQNSFDTHGRLWGTPAHLAPEQLRGEPTFPAADVYALGLLLFECLTGTRAWPGTSVGEILAARHERRAPRLPRIPGLPREVIRLYDACVAEDAAQRPSAATAAEILRRAAAPVPTVRPPVAVIGSVPAVVRRTRSRRRAAVTASIAVAAAVFSIVGLQVANGYATPGGRQAEAAVDGGTGAGTMPRKPQIPTTIAPPPASSAPGRDEPVDAEPPLHRRTTAPAPETTTTTADTPTHPEHSSAPEPGPRPTTTTAPTTTPTRNPPPTPTRTPTHPPTTTTAPDPDPEPTTTAPTTTPPTESTTTPPQSPEPEDPPSTSSTTGTTSTTPILEIILAGSGR